MLEELRNHVAHKIGAIAKPANIVFTPELPKTRSGQDHAPAAARRGREPRRSATRPRSPTRPSSTSSRARAEALRTRAPERDPSRRVRRGREAWRALSAGSVYGQRLAAALASSELAGRLTASQARTARRPRTGRSRRACSCSADDVLRDPLDVLGGDGVEAGEHRLRLLGPPCSTSRRSPYMIVPCGLSSPSTKRPFAKARAFSSSAAGTGSSAIRRSSAAIVVTASSMRWMSTPAWA